MSISPESAISAVRRFVQGGRASTGSEDTAAVRALTDRLAAAANTSADSLRDALDRSDGGYYLSDDEARAVLAVYDWLNTVPVSVAASSELKVGTKVVCPTQRALGDHFSGHVISPTAIGTIVGIGTGEGETKRFRVIWEGDPAPRSDFGWWHFARELVPAVSQTVTPAALPELKVGGKVICPSKKALYEELEGIEGVGTVERLDFDGTWYVRWPSGQKWYHHASELVPVHDLKVGDRVTCPSRKALGANFERHIATSSTLGTIVATKDDASGSGRRGLAYAVRWDGDRDPSSFQPGWYHWPEELVLVQVAPAPAPAPVSKKFTVEGTEVPHEALVRAKVQLDAGNKIQAIKVIREATHCGLKAAKDLVESADFVAFSFHPAPATEAEPAIIEKARQAVRRDDTLTRDQDWQLVRAMLADERFRNAVLRDDDDDHTDEENEAREAIAGAFRGSPFYGSEYKTLLRVYDRATGKLDTAKVEEYRRLKTEADRLAARLEEMRAEGIYL